MKKIETLTPFKRMCVTIGNLPTSFVESMSYYECLCWLVDYLENTVIPTINNNAEAVIELQDAFTILKNYVDNYFDNLDVQEEINNKLDALVEDGTMAQIINEDIFSELNNKVDGVINNIGNLEDLDTTNNDNIVSAINEVNNNNTNTVNTMPLQLSADEEENFRNYIRYSICSYLARNNFSDCVTNSNAFSENIIFVYALSKGFLGEFTSSYDPVYTDTEIINGVEYKKFYADCSTLLSLILRGKDYASSPYKLAFDNPSYTKEQMYTASSITTDFTKPYYIDFLNKTNSFKMAFVMNSSGNTLRTISKKENGELTINRDIINTLDTGDAIFMGDSTSFADKRYKGIHHCCIYLKTLEELAPFCEQYGMTLNVLPDENDDLSYGYVVEMVNSNTPGTDYKNCLRIRSLYNRMKYTATGSTWNYVYAAKSVANALNSNLCYNNTTSLYNDNNINRMYFKDEKKFFNYNVDTGKLLLKNLNLTGNQVIRGVDLNDLTENGMYVQHYADPQYSSGIQNLPSDFGDSAQYFTLLVIGSNDSNQAWCTQIIIDIQSGRNRIYSRTRGTGTWSAWKQLTNT